MTFGQNVYTDDIEGISLKIDGSEWYPLEINVELTTHATPDYVDMIISPPSSVLENLDGSPSQTAENGGLLGTEFTLDVNTELEFGGRSTEQTRIFTGKLANLSTAAQGAWEAVAFDPSHQSFASADTVENQGNFFNSTINLPASTDSTKFEENDPYFAQPSITKPYASQIKASELAKNIIEESDISSSANDYEIKLADHPGYTIGKRPDGSLVQGGIDRLLFFSSQEITVKEALERITTATNSAYWFDENGKFYIGAVEQGSPIDVFDLSFITETSAGKSTPAWQGVQVIGSGVVSEDGWDKTNMNSENPSLSAAALKDDGKTDTDKLKEPVYTYRNLEIQTQAEADAVAKEIVNDLKDQQEKGKVSVVGLPEIRPLDAIQMPQASDENAPNYNPDQPMGGKRYSVVKVVHKINPSDGFVTDIHVGGLKRESSTLFNEDIDLSDAASEYGPAGRTGL